jgi:predicted MFS family arabinose efflux permease
MPSSNSATKLSVHAKGVVTMETEADIPVRPISGVVTGAMAVAAGIAVANIYYNQPLLGMIERDVGDPGLTGFIPTVTQLGYAAGLFLLVPLGDLMDRRRLIVTQFLLLSLAALAAAVAPSAVTVLGASLVLGAMSTVAQQVVPFAASLASPARRGRVIGTVMAGVLGGILLSRTLAGFVATRWGWQEMFWLAVPLALGAAGLMALLLPRTGSQTSMFYRGALISVVRLWREEPRLRRATIVQAVLFAAFIAFWTVLALHLEEPRFRLGANVAGLFGLVGVVGVAAAPLAGRIADQRGPALVIGLGAGLTMLSWLVFGLWDSIPGLVLGVILLDFGVQSALVSNQHIVFSLRPLARSRINTVFMTGMFLGGALGSAGASLAWSHGAWSLLCGYGVLLSAGALGYELIGRRARRCQVARIEVVR